MPWVRSSYQWLLLSYPCSASIAWASRENERKTWSCHVHGNCKIRIAVVPSKYEAGRRSSLIHVMRLMIIQVMRCAILDQTLINGVWMVGLKSVSIRLHGIQTLINGVWMVGQKSVSLNPFAWYSNSYLTLNHSNGM